MTDLIAARGLGAANRLGPFFWPGDQAGLRRRQPRQHRRGLVNVILTVAVAGAVIAGLVAAYSQVTTSMRASNTQQLVNTIESTIRNAYNNMPTYEAALTEIAIGSMPTSAIQGTGTNRIIVTPWGGEIIAGGGDTVDTEAASGNRFWVLISDLPEAACETIAQGFLNRSDVVGIAVDGAASGTFSRMIGGTVIGAFDTVTEIEAECDGSDDDRVGVVFRG